MDNVSSVKRKDFLFPQVRPLEDNPKARRLAMIKTLFKKPICVSCCRRATYLWPLDKRHYCNQHLPAEARKRLTMEWQWLNIILPIDQHVTSRLDHVNRVML